jgi:HTH-type transcriptional repressor of NAD biosynthesis genes
MTRVGLALGKFAPLHHGHELLIRSALGETDHVVVLIYDCPEITAIPLQTRTGWIRDLFPTVEVVEAWDGPRDVGDTPEIMRRHEAYLLDRLAGRRITHFYSSEFYGAHVSAALHAIDRRVDEARLVVPISATRIRADPFAHRASVSPRVYRDLVCNVAVLGAPATGKTTLCERLAREFDTQWMPEYGREYWERHQVDRRLTPDQLCEIATGHLEREESLLLEANRYLFTDTTALTTLLFSRHYHGSAPAMLHALADASATRYHATFVCDDDIPYDDTWDRSGAVNRARMQRWTVEALAARRLPFTLLRGTAEQRIETVRRVLATIAWL